jgi:hypothetical protein
MTNEVPVVENVRFEDPSPKYARNPGIISDHLIVPFSLVNVKPFPEISCNVSFRFQSPIGA